MSIKEQEPLLPKIKSLKIEEEPKKKEKSSEKKKEEISKKKNLQEEKKSVQEEQTPKKREDLEEKQKNKKIKINKNKAKKESIKKDKVKKDKPKKEKKEEEFIAEDYYDYVDDWCPYKEIKNGTIVTTDGRYIKVIMVLPLNYNSKSIKDRNLLMSRFENWVKFAPDNFCIHSMNVDASVSWIRDLVRSKMKNETDQGLINCANDYLNLCRALSTAENSKPIFFITHERTGSSKNEVSILEEMQSTQIKLSNYLTSVGNVCIYSDNNNDENMFLYDLLYKIFNRKSSLKEGVYDRIDKIIFDTMAVNNLQIGVDDIPEIPLSSFICPRGVAFTNPNYTMADGLYYTHLYIKKKGYPDRTLAGWIDIITRYKKGVDLKMFYKKLNRQIVLDETRRLIRWKTSDAKTANSDKIEDISDSLSYTQIIRDALRNRNEDLYDVFGLITITANSIDELMDLKADLKAELRVADILTADCFAREEECYLAALPGMYPSKVLWEKGRRNFLTSSVVSTYMFMADQVQDETGVVLGKADGSLFSINPFNSKKHKNANMIITGTSGAGKTYTTQLITRRLRILGIRIIKILPVKGYEYARGCKAIGGEFIKLAPGTNTCINIFEIRPQDNADNELIDGESYERDSWLTAKINSIKAFIDLLMQKEPLSVVEKAKIEVALTDMYRKLGITNDNNSIYKTDGSLKKMPIMEDFYNNYIKDDKDLTRVKAVLNSFITGQSKNLNGQTNVNLDNRYVCLDVSNCPDDLLPAFMYLAIDLAYSKLTENRTDLGIVVVDETWKAMAVEAAGSQIYKMAKLLRGYGAGLLSATQEVGDLLHAKGGHGKALINNAHNKILLQAGDEDAEELGKLLKLSDEEIDRLQCFEQGEGFLFSNKEKSYINIYSTKKDEEDFTTNPIKLREIAERNKRLKENANTH